MGTSSSVNLEDVRIKHNLPGLAALLIKDGKVVEPASYAVGFRKQGDPTKLTFNDKFHIGSITKSMTATLTAILIEQNILTWETTIISVFPELKGKINAKYEKVTVYHLLLHLGGVPGSPPAAAWQRAWQQIGTPFQQRREFIEAVLALPPEADPGTKKIYSNQGYMIVGAILEKLTATSWETLITSHLFVPLQMSTAGFGPPGNPGRVDEPWGHTRNQSQRTITPSQSDNPPALGPAGTVHCSLGDFAKYLTYHLTASPQLLSRENLLRLQTAPAGRDYACGWIVAEREWAHGKAITHGGSNTFWFMNVWLAPKRKFAVVVATNIADEAAHLACDEVIKAYVTSLNTVG